MKKNTAVLLGVLFLLLVTSSIQARPINNAYVNSDWVVVAPGRDPDGRGPARAMGLDAFAHIQDAVLAVSSNGDVHVAPGTYTEQVVIRNKDIRLLGDSSETTIIQSPENLTESFDTGVTNKPIIFVTGSVSTVIDGFSIDGLGHGNVNQRFMGVSFFNAAGVLRDLHVLGVRNTPIDGSQQGIAVYVRNTDEVERSIRMEGLLIEDYQKNGIAVVGKGLFASIRDSQIKGSGPVPEIAQNGIQIGFGATGHIENNLIEGNQCVSEAAGCVIGDQEGDGDMSSGILVYHPGERNIVVQNNYVEGNQCSLCLVGVPSFHVWANTFIGKRIGVLITDSDGYSSAFGLEPIESDGDIRFNLVKNHLKGIQILTALDDSPAPNVSVHLNSLVGNSEAGLDSDVFVDAQRNWWGCSDGPLTGVGCDRVHSATDGLVDVTPWLRVR